MKVGNLVRCLYNFDKERKAWPYPYPNKGDILTISHIEKHPNGKDNCLFFEELKTCPLWHKNFRKIIIPRNVLKEIEKMKQDLASVEALRLLSEMSITFKADTWK